MDYVTQSRHRHFEPPNRSLSTQVAPGTPQKIEVMAQRYQAGQPLHHPDDAASLILPIRQAVTTFSDFLVTDRSLELIT